MVDSISRTKAINVVYRKYPYNAEQNKCDEIVDALKALPSTDKPIGEWIDVNGDGSLWRCNQCKDTACCKGNYCPTCGVKMKENKKKEENNNMRKVPLYVYASWDRSEE